MPPTVCCWGKYPALWKFEWSAYWKLGAGVSYDGEFAGILPNSLGPVEAVIENSWPSPAGLPLLATIIPAKASTNAETGR